MLVLSIDSRTDPSAYRAGRMPSRVGIAQHAIRHRCRDSRLDDVERLAGLSLEPFAPSGGVLRRFREPFPAKLTRYGPKSTKAGKCQPAHPLRGVEGTWTLHAVTA